MPRSPLDPEYREKGKRMEVKGEKTNEKEQWQGSRGLRYVCELENDRTKYPKHTVNNTEIIML